MQPILFGTPVALFLLILLVEHVDVASSSFVIISQHFKRSFAELAVGFTPEKV